MRSYALGEVSFRKISISEALGGRPVRSSDTRRIKVRASAAGAGAKPWASSRASTNRSIEFFGHAAFRTVDKAGFTGALKAQCSCHGAPCSIQRFSSSICRGLRLLCENSGGMRRAGEGAEMRW